MKLFHFGYSKIKNESNLLHMPSKPKPISYTVTERQKGSGLWYPAKCFANKEIEIIERLSEGKLSGNKSLAIHVAKAVAANKNLPFKYEEN